MTFKPGNVRYPQLIAGRRNSASIEVWFPSINTSRRLLEEEGDPGKSHIGSANGHCWFHLEKKWHGHVTCILVDPSNKRAEAFLIFKNPRWLPPPLWQIEKLAKTWKVYDFTVHIVLNTRQILQGDIRICTFFTNLPRQKTLFIYLNAIKMKIITITVIDYIYCCFNCTDPSIISSYLAFWSPQT